MCGCELLQSLACTLRYQLPLIQATSRVVTLLGHYWHCWERGSHPQGSSHMGVARVSDWNWRRLWLGVLSLLTCQVIQTDHLRERQKGFLHPLVLLPASCLTWAHWLTSILPSSQSPPDCPCHQLAWDYMELPCPLASPLPPNWAA